MHDLKKFLELLTHRFPPPGRLSHSLRLLEGGTIRLSLWIEAGECEQIMLNDQDLTKTPELLVEAIVLTRGRAS